MADYGLFLLIMACVLSGYGFLAALGSAKLRHRRLFRSAQWASTIVFAICLGAAVILWTKFFARDFSLSYVFRNSSLDLPWFYTFSAFWSALEGSHLLWTLLMALFSCIAHWTFARENEHIMPYVSATLQLVLCWMFYLAATYSDPFEQLFPVPEQGNGMNALLQNPYMMIHPPMLFTGYTGLAIPFAYGMAALCYGDITEGWLRSVRRWTLLSWVFLTVGVFLGGRWAYVELGWGGYWAWDPVENSSFMPWLFSTSLLHALLVQERLGHLKRLSILLAIFSFFFSFFGTFITRSGVVSSVHSFAQSPIGPNYLAYILAILGGSFVMYAWRAPSILPAETTKSWGVSRESALVVTQFLLITFALIIFIGTVYPIVSELLIDERFNVQAPYFNTFAPYIGLSLVLAIGVGNLLRYQSKKLAGGKVGLIVAFLGAFFPTLLFMYAAEVFSSSGFSFAVQAVGIYLVFWCCLSLLVDLFVTVKNYRNKFSMLLKYNLAYFGAFIAHIGVLVAVLGFLGNYRGVDKTITLKAGESLDLMGYTMRFNGMEILHEHNAELFSAPLHLEKSGVLLGTLFPARAKYPTSQELIHEIDFKTTFWHDLYVVLADFDRSTGKQVTLQIYFNPTVRLVWISCVLLALGGLVCLFDRRRGLKSKDHLFYRK